MVGDGFYSSIWLQDIKIKKGSLILNIANAVDSSWVQPMLYGYNGAYYEDSLLSAWQGYWFSALVDGCTFLESKTFGGKSKNVGTQHAVSLSDWTLTLNAKYGNAEDKITKLGVSRNATDGFDNWYDYLKPPIPPGSNYIEVYFKRDGWVSVSNKFNQDIRAPFKESETKSWEFSIATSGKGTVVLSWQSIQSMLSELSLTLIDLKTGEELNMRETENYTYTSNGINNFRIDVSTKKDSKIPSYIFALYQNVPNPFMTRTTIAYSVAKDCRVNLSLYDLSGRVVKTLSDKEVKTGYHTVSFDGKNIVSGIYFLKLRAGEFETTRKIAVMH